MGEAGAVIEKWRVVYNKAATALGAGLRAASVGGL
jgi:hypothetical protein